MQAKKPLFNKFFRAILSQSDTAVRQAKDRKRESPKCENTLLSAARFVEVGVLWGFMRSLRSRLYCDSFRSSVPNSQYGPICEATERSGVAEQINERSELFSSVVTFKMAIVLSGRDVAKVNMRVSKGVNIKQPYYRDRLSVLSGLSIVLSGCITRLRQLYYRRADNTYYRAGI